MSRFCITLFMIVFTPFGYSAEVSQGDTIQIPSLLSFETLMQLRIEDRQDYFDSIGEAVAKFESGIYRSRITGGETAARPVFDSDWLPSLLPDAQAATTFDPHIWDNPDEVHRLARKCTKSGTVMKKARATFLKDINSDKARNWCMIGGMNSEYDVTPKSEFQNWGKCHKVGGAGDYAKYCTGAHETLCNPILFCDQKGDVTCAGIGPNTAMTCFRHANKRKTKDGSILNLSACKYTKDMYRYPEEIKKAIASQDKMMSNVCTTPGGATLYCNECYELGLSVHQANLEAQGKLSSIHETTTKAIHN